MNFEPPSLAISVGTPNVTNNLRRAVHRPLVVATWLYQRLFSPTGQAISSDEVVLSFEAEVISRNSLEWSCWDMGLIRRKLACDGEIWLH